MAGPAEARFAQAELAAVTERGSQLGQQVAQSQCPPLHGQIC